MRRYVWFLLMLSGSVFAQERWFEVQIGGKPAGRAHEVVRPVAGGAIETVSDSQTLIARIDTKLDIRVLAQTVEGEDGQLRSVHVEAAFSADTTFTDVTISGQTATVRERAGQAAMHERTVPLVAQLLGPEAVRKRCAAELHKPGDHLVVAIWAAELGIPLQARRTVTAIEGSYLRVKEDYEDTAFSRTVWLSSDGELQRAESPAPFGVLALQRVKEEPALAAVELPKDVFERTLLRSNVRLPKPRELERLVVRFPWEGELSTDTQRIIDGLLEVRRAETPQALPDADAPEEFLSANMLIDSDDPGVRSIVAQVPGEGWTRAVALTRWTSRNMQFDPGIVLAPASELARDRRGTCAGYATLLASLLRAARIPARVVFGYVYTGGIFGGHAWVEARFGGHWIPLDAALPSEGPADAARIALVHDSLREGAGRVLSALQVAYGEATVEVVEYGGARGKPAPYLLKDQEYRNTGLGLSLNAPPGLRFSKVDQVWPDRTLFLLKGKAGEVQLLEGEMDPALSTREALRAALQEPCTRTSVAGRPGCAALNALAFADGSTVYVLKARGERGREFLQATASRIQLR
jgi:transglutaminase-like putative cysteine protease